MSFVQLLTYRGTRIEEMRALDAEWQAATEGRRTLRRQIICRDRADAAEIVAIFSFDSFADAMVNSNLPETQAGAARFEALMDGPPTFLDLDVIEERNVGAGDATSFVQVIDVRTRRLAEIQALSLEYEKSVADRLTVRRSLVTRHRDDPDRYLILAFFENYESAMQNSELPETSAFAEKFATLLDEPPAFRDLDVIEDRSF